MYRKRKNNGIKFLVFLLVFGFIAVRFGNNLVRNPAEGSTSKSSENIVEDTALEGCDTCNTVNVEERIQIGDGYEIFYMTDDGAVVDITEYLSEEDKIVLQENMYIDGQALGITEWWERIRLSLGNLLAGLADFTGILDFFTCEGFTDADTLESAIALCKIETSSRGLYYDDGGTVSSGGSGISVSTGTRVVMSQVTYPLAFFLGQYVHENNLREISYRSTEYSANGENIEEEYLSKTLAPGDAGRFREDIENLGTVRKDFLVKAFLSLTGGNATEEGLSESEIGIENETDAAGECPFVKYDYNPEVANYMAYHEEFGGYFRQQSPGGDEYEIPGVRECLLEGRDYYMSPGGNILACINFYERALAFFQRTFTNQQWEECTEGVNCRYEYSTTTSRPELVCDADKNPEGCMDTASIGIEMTPIFGKPYDCNVDDDRLCANAFLTNSYRASLSPDQAGSKKNVADDPEETIMYFIGTPCKANLISQSNERERLEIDVVCLWDASQSHLNYRLQAKDRYPGQEEFPQTFRDYWNGVLQGIGVSANFYDLNE